MVILSLYIARQHVMHAERAIVMANLSVRPSVGLSNARIVCKRMDISSSFWSSGRHTIL